VELENISGKEVPKKQVEKDDAKREIPDTKMVSKNKSKNKKQ
jgi:hypothetical protein